MSSKNPLLKKMAERNKAYEASLEGKNIETENEPIASSMSQNEIEANTLKKAKATEVAAAADVLKTRFNPLAELRTSNSGQAKKLETNAEWKNTTRKNKKGPIGQGTEWFGMDKAARERAASIVEAGKEAQKKMNLVTKNSRAELRKIEKEVTESEAKVGATKKEIDEIAPKKEAAAAEVTKFQGQVAAAKKELADAKQEYKKREAQKRIDAAKMKLATAEAAVATIESSLSPLQERLVGEEAEVVEATGRLEEKEKALKVIQKNATKVESALIKAKQMNAMKSLKKKGQNQKAAAKAAANKKALEKLEAATAAANAAPELNENALEELESVKRIAAAKEKAKKLIEKGIENITLADKKAKAEGKPIVSEPAYVPKPVELNEDDAPEPAPTPAAAVAPSEPAAAEATPLTDLPPGWEEHRNNQGQVYYNNGTTTQWERPNGSSVSNTKPTEEFEAQLATEKAAKETAEAQVAELKAAKETAEAQVAELKLAKETAEGQLAELKAAKEATEAEVAKLKAAKEATEAEVAKLKTAKESAETELAELKATNQSNKLQETSEPTSPTSSNSKNTTSNNPQPSEEEQILQILKHGEDGFPPLELPHTLKTNFEHAIKPFYDKMVSEPNQAYAELYVKLYVFCYAIKKEEIPDGNLFEEGNKTDLAEFLSNDIKQQVKITPYYDLMFRLGVSQFYKESLTDTLHIINNLNEIDLNT